MDQENTSGGARPMWEPIKEHLEGYPDILICIGIILFTALTVVGATFLIGKGIYWIFPWLK
jgi:hypothetical protein